MLGAQPGRHGDETEERRLETLERFAPAIDFLGLEAVTARGQQLVESQPVGPVGEQGQEKGADELGVGQPGGVAGLAALKGKDVDEDGLGAAEEDVVGRGVLEAEAIGEQALRQVEREQAGGVEHLGGPLIGEARKVDAFVLQDHACAASGVEFADGGVGEELIALRGVERTGAGDAAAAHEFLAGRAGEEGLEIGDANGVNGAEDAALIAEKTASRITERCSEGVRARRSSRFAQSLGPFI